jgi:hypothetical protein
MRRLFVVLLALSLTACATYPGQVDDAYIGHSVSEVVLKLGPPTTRFDAGSGRMAFQWLNYGECSRSATATTTKPGSTSLADWTVESWQETRDCAAAK